MILTYTNQLGKEVVFAAEAGALKYSPYMLTELDGAHGLQSQVLSVAQYPQDGATYIGSRVEPRDITFQGYITRDKAKNRIALLEVMKPKDLGTLTLTRGKFKRRIDCVVERAPYFASSRGDLFTCLLFCPQPYWEDANGEIDALMNGWIGLFEFEVAIDQEIGVQFGTRTESYVLDVFNPGDAEAGFEAIFEAVGVVTNPQILNVTTGQAMKFNVVMASGDVLRVSTAPYSRWALLTHEGGAIVNAMQYITPDFVFLRLAPGVNQLRASADDGGVLLNTNIRFRARYVGV
ncbi:hypothetical protein AGMMS49992_34070 [Clostridia bacterium]|nr:hypothetical protein AGMMS49992_34070 [Clostridia bacterium]